MERFAARVLRDGLGFGEGPRWHEGRLWFSDFYRHGIFSIDAEGQGERLEHDVPTQPSGLGWLPDGDLLYVSMTDQRVMRVHEGETTLFCGHLPILRILGERHDRLSERGQLRRELRL